MEQIGTSARTAMTPMIRIRQETGLNIGCRAGRISDCEGSTVAVLISNLHAATFESEQTSRTFLNEQDYENKHRNLCQDRAPEWLNHFADDPEAHSANNGTGKLANPPQHDHHEGVDDVVLTQVRTHVPDLGKRASAQTGNSCTEGESVAVDLPGTDSGARRHPAILRGGSI